MHEIYMVARMVTPSAYRVRLHYLISTELNVGLIIIKLIRNRFKFSAAESRIS